MDLILHRIHSVSNVHQRITSNLQVAILELQAATHKHMLLNVIEKAISFIIVNNITMIYMKFFYNSMQK